MPHFAKPANEMPLAKCFVADLTYESHRWDSQRNSPRFSDETSSAYYESIYKQVTTKRKNAYNVVPSELGRINVVAKFTGIYSNFYEAWIYLDSDGRCHYARY